MGGDICVLSFRNTLWYTNIAGWENPPILTGETSTQMVNFPASYVSLPEGNPKIQWPAKNPIQEFSSNFALVMLFHHCFWWISQPIIFIKLQRSHALPRPPVAPLPLVPALTKCFGKWFFWLGNFLWWFYLKKNTKTNTKKMKSSKKQDITYKMLMACHEKILWTVDILSCCWYTVDGS